MKFMELERGELEKFLPGLDQALTDIGLASLERDASPALRAFKDLKGPGLLIPADLGGLDAGPVAAVRIQRAIGSRSPSLAVATTMHHFSVATLNELARAGLESILLEAIASHSLLVASGFGEGNPGQGILSPNMKGVCREGSVVISGSKKPCSLGMSMDLLTASLRIDGRLAVVLIPPALPGVSRKPFWRAQALMGAENCEIVLDNVEVPERLVSYSADGSEMDDTQIGAFLWFESLISASYIGAASALVELALAKPSALTPNLTGAIGAIEMAMASIEWMAKALENLDRPEDLLGKALLIRYGVQEAINSAAAVAAESAGGTGFATRPEISLLLATVRALAFHPPAKAMTAAPLGQWLSGKPLRFH